MCYLLFTLDIFHIKMRTEAGLKSKVGNQKNQKNALFVKNLQTLNGPYGHSTGFAGERTMRGGSTTFLVSRNVRKKIS